MRSLTAISLPTPLPLAASLFISGGCTPARDAAHDHCYSDLWSLPLDGLMQGGKQLNATAQIVEVDEQRLLLNSVPGQRLASTASASLTRPSITAPSPALNRNMVAVGARAANASLGGRAAAGGALRAHANQTSASATNNTDGHPSDADESIPLYVDTSLNDGVDVVTAAVINGG